MGILEVTLILATFLCSLVAGFLFAFAVVVMAGIRHLGNREFIRAFQAMDGIIQDGRPIFMVTWLGSGVALILAAALAIGHMDGADLGLLLFAAVAYMLGVQLPTIIVNVPLNNRLQHLDVDAMDDAALEAGRESFEGRWNRWNAIRTVVSCLVSVLLIVVVLGY